MQIIYNELPRNAYDYIYDPQVGFVADLSPQFVNRVPMIIVENWKELASISLKYNYFNTDFIKIEYWIGKLKDDQSRCRIN